MSRAAKALTCDSMNTDQGHDDDIQKALEQADVDIELAINKLKVSITVHGLLVYAQSSVDDI